MKTLTKKAQPVKEEVEEFDLEWDIEPVEEKWSTAKCLIWQTKCGEYRVYRIDSLDGEKPKFGACQFNGKDWWSLEGTKLGPGYPKYYFDLQTALSLIEDRANSKHSNSESVLAYAIQHKLTLAVPTPSKAKSAPHNASQPLETVVKKRTRSSGPVNAQGVKEGSPEHRALQVLTLEPKTMKRIVDEAGLASTIYNKLNKLAKEGKIKKTSEGYCLPG